MDKVGEGMKEVGGGEEIGKRGVDGLWDEEILCKCVSSQISSVSDDEKYEKTTRPLFV